MQKITMPRWWWMIPLLIGFTAIAAGHLNEDALWFDEWITYFISGGGSYEPRSLPDILYWTAIDNSWPPAFFLLLRLWDVIGSHYFSDRVLPLLIGLIAISLQYRLTKQLFQQSSGILAAVVLGSCAFFLFYMHEIRGYTLYVLFPALSGWLYWLLLDDRYAQRRAVRWGFVLSIMGTLYTHYIGIAVVAGIFFYHILFERPDGEAESRKRFWTIFRLWLNGCLLYAPWVAVLIVSFINESLTNRDIPTPDLLRAMVYGFSNNLWWIALPALGLTLSMWRQKEIRFLWVWGLTILGVAVAGNIFADFLFHPRHIMGLLPAWAALIAAGLLRLAKIQSLLPWFIGGIWAGTGILAAATPDFMNAVPRHIRAVPLPAMNTIVDTANRCLTEQDTLILSVDQMEEEWVHDQPLLYYLQDTSAPFISLNYVVSDAYRAGASPLVPDDLEESSYPDLLTHFIRQAENVYLVSLPDLHVDAELEQLEQALIQHGYTDCGTWIARDDLVGWGYSRNPEAGCEQIQVCTGEQANP